MTKKLALRVYPTKKKEKRPVTTIIEEKKTYSKIIIFDCETSIDQFQNLKVGYYRIYQSNMAIEDGMFYEPKNITEKEKTIIKKYCERENIETWTREEFLKNVFFPEVYDGKTLCCGFNLPFDLSRLCIHFGQGQNKAKGGFSLQFLDESYRRITIKQLTDTYHTIRFTRISNKDKDHFGGYFLDVQKLASVLSGIKKISLAKACSVFRTKEKKEESEEHGTITFSYLDYLVKDVRCTYQVYEKVIEEFQKYNVDIDITKVFSEATLGKGALARMGIRPYLQCDPTISNELLGNLMSAYYGGRVECKIRKEERKVATLDFTSQYPSITLLMGLWSYITSKKIETIDDTENVQQFLNKVTLKQLQNKNIWKKLNVLVEIHPDNDILPSRSNYDPQSETFNIGINQLTSDKKIFYALPDIIASKLLSGKIPKIARATRFIVKDTQENLQPTEIYGIKINPNKENFIKKIVEERQKIKIEIKQLAKKDAHHRDIPYLDSKAKALKLVANSTTYGIFVQMNPQDNKEDTHIFSNKDFEAQDAKVEKPGPYFNPLVAVMEIAGARLTLAMAEKYVKQKGECHTYMDTDSIFVPVKLSREVSDFFKPLNPYDLDIPFLKIEREDRFFYGISSKRYVLYTKDKGKILIDPDPNEKDYKLHGLGHLTSPFLKSKKQKKKEEKWQVKIWEDILKLYHAQITPKRFSDKYLLHHAITKQTISTWNIMHRFKKVNKNKPISQQIKPFNFCLIGIGNDVGENDELVKPLAPYSDNPQTIVEKPFIDYKTGKTMQGSQYWKNLSETITEYVNHPEYKFKNGKETGIMQRATITNPELIYMGKEIKNLENQDTDKEEAQIYIDQEATREKILTITYKEAQRKGVSRSQIANLKKEAREQTKIKITNAVKKILK